MRRSYKRSYSKGFTLVEMILVVAIILILASSLIFAVSRYINAANQANQDVIDASSHVEQEIEDSEALLANYGF